MRGPSRADLYLVHESRPTADLLDAILGALPAATAVVAHRSGQRLVASMAGVFVLDPDSDDNVPAPDSAGVRAAERAATAALATRELLAQHLSWVPFIDWFVVCRTDWQGVAHDVVTLDLVAATVLEGHAVSAEVVASIRGLLSSGSLEPEWHHGLPTLTPIPPIG